MCGKWLPDYEIIAVGAKGEQRGEIGVMMYSLMAYMG